MDNKVKCPGCGYEVSTKEEGTLFRSHKVRGEKCYMSDEPVPTWDDEAETPESDSNEPEQSHESDDTSDASVTPERSSEKPTETPKTKTFAFKMNVGATCPYLDDARWHHNNAVMAEKKALKAGLFPTGEAQHTDTKKSGNKINLTYEVPVR